jgi:hypothetical protein
MAAKKQVPGIISKLPQQMLHLLIGEITSLTLILAKNKLRVM